MAQIEIDVLEWQDHNLRRRVYYNSSTQQPGSSRSVTYTSEAIDPAFGWTSPGSTAPTSRDYAAGTVMLDGPFCEGTDGVTLTATATAPYASISVEANAVACQAPPPGTCDLQAVVASKTDTQVVFTVTTSHPLFQGSADGVLFVPGQDNFAGLQPGFNYPFYFKDAAGCTLLVYVTTNEAPATEQPQGIEQETFTTSDGATVTIYYQASPTRKITAVASDGKTQTITAAEHGHEAGELINAFCEGTTQVRVVAQMTYPYAYLQTTENSPGCGYVEPSPEPDPVAGCGDADATNYVPGGTDNATCLYGPRWRSVWPQLKVAVPTYSGNTKAYLAGEVWAGYPAGHPWAAQQPLAKVADVRATVSLVTGLAEFDLGPWLQPLFPRLDANRAQALGSDLVLGYDLRTRGVVWERGYALNAAVPDIQHFTGKPLTPFAVLPGWQGFPYEVAELGTDATGRFGVVEAGTHPVGAYLPCPQHPVPVCWLDRSGGYGYWVFGGRHAYGQATDEGQGYTEALTGEQRLSSRIGGRRTVALSTGYFGRAELAAGLLTLREAVQAWARLDGPDEPWVPVLVEAGTFPAWRAGQRRFEATIQVTEATPRYVQGQ